MPNNRHSRFAKLCFAFLLYTSAFAFTGAAPADHAVLVPDSVFPRTTAPLSHVLTSFKLEGVAFDDALYLIRDSVPCNIATDWAALESSKVGRKSPATLALNHVTIWECIYSMLRVAGPPHAALVAGEGSVIVISTPEDIEHRILAIYRRRAASVNAETQTKLQKTVAKVAFNGTPLRDALKEISGMSGIPISADWDVLTAHGVQPSIRVTQQYRNIEIDDLLDVMLAEVCGGKGMLTYTADKEGIRVTPSIVAEPKSPAEIAARLLVVGEGLESFACTFQRARSSRRSFRNTRHHLRRIAASHIKSLSKPTTSAAHNSTGG